MNSTPCSNTLKKIRERVFEFKYMAGKALVKLLLLKQLVAPSVLLSVVVLMMSCSEQNQSNNSEANVGPTSFFGNMPSNNTLGNAASVQRNTLLKLPEDHKSHPEFQLEWWYLTFVLEDENENEYGMQFTLFRFSGAFEGGLEGGLEEHETPNSPQHANSWSNSQQWMGHASLHSKDEHFFEERFAAGGVGNAYVNTVPFEAVIDDWNWKANNTNADLFPSLLNVTFPQAANNNTSAFLQLTAEGPYIKQGDNGYSKKTYDERLRSYYYSQPFIKANGTLVVNGKQIIVKGLGWFDHEWTSHLANSEAMGWDWFSIHFDNGDKLMAFRMHATKKDAEKEAKGNSSNTSDTGSMSEVFTTASFIRKDGRKETLSGNEVSIQPEKASLITFNNKEHSVPTTWRISIPSKEINVLTSPFKEDQWNPSLFPYYEGRIHVTGTHRGTGFMELTGY